MKIKKRGLGWVPNLNQLTRKIIERQYPDTDLLFCQSEREMLHQLSLFSEAVAQLIVPASEFAESKVHYERKYPWMQVRAHNFQKEVAIAVHINGPLPAKLMSKLRPIELPHLDQITNDFMLQLYVGQHEYNEVKQRFKSYDMVTVFRLNSQHEVVYCIGGRPKTLSPNQRLEFISSIKQIDSKFVLSLPAQFVFFVPPTYQYHIRNCLAEHGRVPSFQFNFQPVKRLFFVCNHQFESMETFLKKRYSEYQFLKIPNPFLVANEELLEMTAIVACFQSEVSFVLGALHEYKAHITLLKIPEIESIRQLIMERNKNCENLVYFERPNAVELRSLLPPGTKHVKDLTQLRIFLEGTSARMVCIYHPVQHSRVIDNVIWGRKNVRRKEIALPAYSVMVFYKGCECEEQFERYKDECGEQNVLIIKDIDMVPQNSLVVCYRKDMYQLINENVPLLLRPLENRYVRLFLLSDYIYDSKERELRLLAQAGEIRISRIDDISDFRESLIHRKSFLFFYEKNKHLLKDLPRSSSKRVVLPRKKKLLFVDYPCRTTALSECISINSLYQFSSDVEYLLVVSKANARKAISKFSCYPDTNIKICLASSNYQFSDSVVLKRREPALLKNTQLYVYNLTNERRTPQLPAQRDIKHLNVSFKELQYLPFVYDDKPALFIVENYKQEVALRQLFGESGGWPNKRVVIRSQITWSSTNVTQLEGELQQFVLKQNNFIKKSSQQYNALFVMDDEIQNSSCADNVQIKQTRSVNFVQQSQQHNIDQSFVVREQEGQHHLKNIVVSPKLKSVHIASVNHNFVSDNQDEGQSFQKENKKKDRQREIDLGSDREKQWQKQLNSKKNEQRKRKKKQKQRERQRERQRQERQRQRDKQRDKQKSKQNMQSLKLIGQQNKKQAIQNQQQQCYLIKLELPSIAKLVVQEQPIVHNNINWLQQSQIYQDQLKDVQKKDQIEKERFQLASNQLFLSARQVDFNYFSQNIKLDNSLDMEQKLQIIAKEKDRSAEQIWMESSAADRSRIKLTNMDKAWQKPLLKSRRVVVKTRNVEMFDRQKILCEGRLFIQRKNVNTVIPQNPISLYILVFEEGEDVQLQEAVLWHGGNQRVQILVLAKTVNYRELFQQEEVIRGVYLEQQDLCRAIQYSVDRDGDLLEDPPFLAKSEYSLLKHCKFITIGIDESIPQQLKQLCDIQGFQLQNPREKQQGTANERLKVCKVEYYQRQELKQNVVLVHRFPLDLAYLLGRQQVKGVAANLNGLLFLLASELQFQLSVYMPDPKSSLIDVFPALSAIRVNLQFVSKAQSLALKSHVLCQARHYLSIKKYCTGTIYIFDESSHRFSEAVTVSNPSELVQTLISERIARVKAKQTLAKVMQSTSTKSQLSRTPAMKLVEQKQGGPSQIDDESATLDNKNRSLIKGSSKVRQVSTAKMRKISKQLQSEEVRLEAGQVYKKEEVNGLFYSTRQQRISAGVLQKVRQQLQEQEKTQGNQVQINSAEQANVQQQVPTLAMNNRNYIVLLYQRMTQFLQVKDVECRAIKSPAQIKKYLDEDRPCYLVAHESARRVLYRACELYADRRFQAIIYCDKALSKFMLFKRQAKLVLVTDKIEEVQSLIGQAPRCLGRSKALALSEVPGERSARSGLQSARGYKGSRR